MRRLFLSLLTLATLALVAACGNKGPLVRAPRTAGDAGPAPASSAPLPDLPQPADDDPDGG